MDEKKLLNMLDNNLAAYRVVRHKPVFNIEEACRELGTTPGQEVKNLLCKDTNGFFLFVTRGDMRVDFNALRKSRGTPKVSMASPDEVKTKTGVAIGSVNLFSFPAVYLDESVRALPELNIHPDDNTVTVFVKTEDALRLVPGAVFGSFSKG